MILDQGLSLFWEPCIKSRWSSKPVLGTEDVAVAKPPKFLSWWSLPSGESQDFTTQGQTARSAAVDYMGQQAGYWERIPEHDSQGQAP